MSMANTRVIQGKDFDYLYSYETLVAVEKKDTGLLFVTDEWYSQTTSKHINKWIDGRKSLTVSQSTLDGLL